MGNCFENEQMYARLFKIFCISKLPSGGKLTKFLNFVSFKIKINKSNEGLKAFD